MIRAHIPGPNASVQRGVASPLLVAVALSMPVALFSSALRAQEAARPDAAKGQPVASQVCAACHGADGNGTGPANPKLSAQHPEYLAKQLHDFKVKSGAKEATRPNAIMAGFAAQLSEADIGNVAAYYAAQALKPSVARSKELVELGQRIYRGGIAEKGVPACGGCHSPNGAGIPAQYPRLGGQFAEYTESQLVAFRAGTRNNSPQMVTISGRMSDREIKAVSDYIAGLR